MAAKCYLTPGSTGFYCRPVRDGGDCLNLRAWLVMQELSTYTVRYDDTGETETEVPAEWIRDAA